MKETPLVLLYTSVILLKSKNVHMNTEQVNFKKISALCIKNK